jgi:hypothetical protein
MHESALCLSFIAFLFITAQGFKRPLVPYIKNGRPRPPPGENINTPINTSDQSEFTVKNFLRYTPLLFALTFLLIFERRYYTERKYKYIKIKDEDLGPPPFSGRGTGLRNYQLSIAKTDGSGDSSKQ